MKKAILIHGTSSKEEYYDPSYPTGSNSHWIPWITKQLVIRDIHSVALEMPHSYLPDYNLWVAELERFDLDPGTILVGHSCGAGFIVRYLSENPSIKVAKVVLVAPWLDPENTKQNNFFDFTIDPDITKRVKNLIILHSLDDMVDVSASVLNLRETLNDFQYIELKDKGHFCLNDLGSEEFPELLELLK